MQPSPSAPGPAAPGISATGAHDDVLARIHAAGVVPVIAIDDAGAAGPLADILAETGLGCVEVTLRTEAALSALRAVAGRDDLLAGAGTVLEPDDVDRCVAAGARFIVSPGFDAAVVERCRSLGVPVLPGTATASEVLCARRHGLRAVKFFPAESAGGLTAITSIAAAVPDVRFMPTGGVGPDNLRHYLAAPAVLAVGGSWMAPRNLLAARDWTEIRTRCAAAAGVAAESRASAQ